MPRLAISQTGAQIHQPFRPVSVHRLSYLYLCISVSAQADKEKVRKVKEKRIPEYWHKNTTHPHEDLRAILDRRIREIVKLSDNQCGFVTGCGTIDAIHAARLLVEKHREKQKSVHIAFLDLEKAFDCVPHEVTWYALRQRSIAAGAGSV
ncbi:unnamed protein product [Heligmosomoides polygyrus]|uniref:Reverse transcriptase domain-containing protein n=1 Tax=Heligmosomoides polygyrus TaxID=6339 RepID=A0A183F452_HELPZ|nr:unnamed protein product [Heligmosomoides polygyrus]